MLARARALLCCVPLMFLTNQLVLSSSQGLTQLLVDFTSSQHGLSFPMFHSSLLQLVWEDQLWSPLFPLHYESWNCSCSQLSPVSALTGSQCFCTAPFCFCLVIPSFGVQQEWMGEKYQSQCMLVTKNRESTETKIEKCTHKSSV
jgi:hypothetical protein